MSKNVKVEQVYKAKDVFGGRTLLNIFNTDVLENSNFAWYLDFFVLEMSTFNIKYLVSRSDARINISCDDKSTRKPNAPWSPTDIAQWFTGKDAVTKEVTNHSMVILFRMAGERFGIAFQPYKVFAFGSRTLSLSSGSVWEDYMADGIAGAMRAVASTDKKVIELEAIIIDPTFGTLQSFGVAEDYIMSLSYLLEEQKA